MKEEVALRYAEDEAEERKRRELQWERDWRERKALEVFTHTSLIHNYVGSDRPFNDPFSWRTPPEYLSRKLPFLFRTLNMF